MASALQFGLQKKCKSGHKQSPSLKKQHLGSVIHSPADVAETFRLQRYQQVSNGRVSLRSCDECVLSRRVSVGVAVSRLHSCFQELLCFHSFLLLSVTEKPSSKMSAPDNSVTFFPPPPVFRSQGSVRGCGSARFACEPVSVSLVCEVLSSMSAQIRVRGHQNALVLVN